MLRNQLMTPSQLTAASRAVAGHCNAWERMNTWAYNMVDHKDRGVRELTTVALVATGLREDQLTIPEAVRLGVAIGEVVALREALTDAGHRVHALRAAERTEKEPVEGLLNEAVAHRTRLSSQWADLIHSSPGPH